MTLWQDIRFAVRLLAKDRWFTLVATIALALGIGVNNTVFTLVNAVLIRSLPFDEPDRIVSLGTRDARGRDGSVSIKDYEDWRRSDPAGPRSVRVRMTPGNNGLSAPRRAAGV
jgi:putative ABC transport system permease protein